MNTTFWILTAAWIVCMIISHLACFAWGYNRATKARNAEKKEVLRVL